MTNKARDFAIKWHGDQIYRVRPTAIYKNGYEILIGGDSK